MVSLSSQAMKGLFARKARQQATANRHTRKRDNTSSSSSSYLQNKSTAAMRNPTCCVLILSAIAFLGLVSFALCLVAEVKRTKAEDLKLDGNLCYLPASHAFELVIAALICLSIALITGNVVLCTNYCSSRSKGKVANTKSKKQIIFLTAFSWVSFGVAVILMSVATSMSRRQPYGEGWLDGECYIVKGGVYMSSGFLSLAAISSLLGAAFIMITINSVDQGLKVYADK